MKVVVMFEVITLDGGILEIIILVTKMLVAVMLDPKMLVISILEIITLETAILVIIIQAAVMFLTTTQDISTQKNQKLCFSINQHT